jgi:hypothetical protein
MIAPDYNRRMSPKQQQLEEQSPHFDSIRRATPNMPAAQPHAAEPHNEPSAQPSRNAQPSSPQRPDRNQNDH